MNREFVLTNQNIQKDPNDCIHIELNYKRAKKKPLNYLFARVTSCDHQMLGQSKKAKIRGNFYLLQLLRALFLQEYKFSLYLKSLQTLENKGKPNLPYSAANGTFSFLNPI